MHPSQPNRNAGGSTGLVLIGELWALAFLALLSLPVISLSRESLYTAHNAAARVQARWRAEAAINRALFEFLQHRAQSTWPIDGTTLALSVAGGEVVLAIEDELGKIDLNAASPDLLANLFQAAGAETADAQKLAAVVVAWRTPRKGGPAPAADLAAGGDDSPAVRHGWFDSIDELLQVEGITPALFAKVRDSLTVFSPRGFVDRATASPLTRAALAGGAGDVAADDVTAQGPVTMAALPATEGRVFTVRVSTRTSAAGVGLETGSCPAGSKPSSPVGSMLLSGWFPAYA